VRSRPRAQLEGDADVRYFPHWEEVHAETKTSLRRDVSRVRFSQLTRGALSPLTAWLAVLRAQGAFKGYDFQRPDTTPRG
jgi:hypothetical protein